MITATVRQDSTRMLTVLIHDQDANEVGSIVIEEAIEGHVLNMEVWKDANELVKRVRVRK